MHATKVILAGGQSSRMMQDKAFMLYRGIPFFQHVLKVFNDSGVQGHTVISRCNSNYPSTAFPIPVIDDGEFANCGPMAGIFAGLSYAEGVSPKHPVIFLPVDAICIESATINTLLSSLNDKNVDIVALQKENRINPVACAMHISSLNSIRTALLSNNLSVHKWMNEWNLSTISIPTVQVLSVNTPEELNCLEALPCRTLS